MNRLVVWGGLSNLDSFRHINRHYFEAARKLGIDSNWCDDKYYNMDNLTPGTTVFVADVYARELGAARPGVNYVIHNFDSSHILCQTADPKQLLRLQVWTHDAFGEEWDKCRQFSVEDGILFQPWGTNLLAEEFLEPVFNPFSREAVFVGAVWSELTQYGELGNEQTIKTLIEIFKYHGVSLKLLTHISDQENVNAVRAARLAPAIAGGWQTDHGYLPCRCFKNASYGAAMFTNVPAINNLFKDACVAADSAPGLVDKMLSMKQREYIDLVMSQQRIAARYTYRESIQAIDRAFEELK